MTRHPYPIAHKPTVTSEGGSARITIPSGIRSAIELDIGEKPEALEFDPEEREVLIRFPTDDDHEQIPHRPQN